MSKLSVTVRPTATSATKINMSTPWSSSFSKQPLQLCQLKLPESQSNSNCFGQEYPFGFANSLKSSYYPLSKMSYQYGSKKRIIKKGLTSSGWESMKNTSSTNENQPILEIVILEKQDKKNSKVLDNMDNQKKIIIKNQEPQGAKFFQGSSSACNFQANKSARNNNSNSTLDSERNDFKRSYESQLLSNSTKSQLLLRKPLNNSITQDSTLPSLISGTNEKDVLFLNKTKKSISFINLQTNKMTSNRTRFLSSAQALDFLKPSQEFSDQFLQTSKISFKEQIKQNKNTLSLERIHKLSIPFDESCKFHRSQSDFQSSQQFTQNMATQGQKKFQQRSNFLVSQLVDLKSLSLSSVLDSNNNILSQPAVEYPKINPIINNQLNTITSTIQSLLPLDPVLTAKQNIQLAQITAVDLTEPSIQENKQIILEKQQVQEDNTENNSILEDLNLNTNESQRNSNENKVFENQQQIISLSMPTATNLIKSQQLTNLIEAQIPLNQHNPPSPMNNYPISLTSRSNYGDKNPIQQQFLSNLHCSSARNFFKQQQTTSFQRFTNGFNQWAQQNKKTSLNYNSNKVLFENQHVLSDKTPNYLEKKTTSPPFMPSKPHDIQGTSHLSGNNEHSFNAEEEEDFFNYTQAIKQSRQSPYSEHYERINKIGF